jgi:hypothetical protein
MWLLRLVDGSHALAEVEVGDSGRRFASRSERKRIDLTETSFYRRFPGAVVLRNCVGLYPGRKRSIGCYQVGKQGVWIRLLTRRTPPSKINPERNFSLIDLSRGKSEMVQTEQPVSPSLDGGSDNHWAGKSTVVPRQGDNV